MIRFKDSVGLVFLIDFDMHRSIARHPGQLVQGNVRDKVTILGYSNHAALKFSCHAINPALNSRIRTQVPIPKPSARKRFVLRRDGDGDGNVHETV